MNDEEALALADGILGDLDSIPDQGEDFRESVREKVEGMREWIEEHMQVTAKMVVALENMRAGVNRWMR
jgi:hypothetical protein